MAASGVAHLQAYGIEGPWAVMVTVFGVQGATLAVGDQDLSRPAWRHIATLPELVLEHVSFANLLPIYKAFWFVFGETRPTDKRTE
jgi:hypothetical protein